MIKKITKAIIPAAGLGTRFLPATKACPKEMLPIVDKPTLQYIIEEAQASGITEILIISGRSKRAIEDHFDRNIELEYELESHGKTELLDMIKRISDVNIHYIRQKEPKGLGDAILCAKQFTENDAFAVLLGDDIVYNAGKPALRQIIDVFEKTESTVLGCQEVDKSKVSSYGVVAIDNNKKFNDILPEEIASRTVKVVDMVEKPLVEEAPSRMAVLGRYIITPRIFKILENTVPGKDNEIQLTDALKALAKEEMICAYNFEGKRYDVGDKMGYLEAVIEFALRREEFRDKLLDYMNRIVEKENLMRTK